MSHLSDDQIQTIIDDIIQEMTLRDLVSVAGMDETDVDIVKEVIHVYLRKKMDLEDGEEIGQIMDAFWRRLKETHRLRVVRI